jgi:hypothetical protein
MFRMILVLVAALAPLLAAVFLLPAVAAQDKPLTLLTMLAEYKYPDAELAGGATMSDGGNHKIQSVKCKAVLTTPDPIEKVIKFYADKFETTKAEDPARGTEKAEVEDGDGKSVSVVDDSDGRPVTVRVIVVNKADTSTTLVISRAEGEKKTHIAWSHYVRLGDKR